MGTMKVNFHPVYVEATVSGNVFNLYEDCRIDYGIDSYQFPDDFRTTMGNQQDKCF